MQAMTALFREYKAEIVAIGEVGLDYHWVKEESLRDQQKEAFRFFINFAKELGMPLVVHTREAETDSIEVLEEESAENVLMHCFSGSEKEAKRIINNKWLISVPTSVTNRKVHQTMARIVPLDLMLLETDAPYLAPNKGRNESANIKISAQKIAEIKSISFEEVARKTTDNARKFYHLDERIKEKNWVY
jgi:TatD DNase family protein